MKKLSVDRELVRKIAAGDSLAFNELVNKYYVMVKSLAASLLNNKSDVEDICQEVFLKLYKNINNIKVEYSLSSYIYKIATNCCMDYFRKNNKHKNEALEAYENIECCAELSAEKLYENKELAVKLKELIKALPIEQRTVIVLYEIHGISQKEIAEIIGCAVGTVSSRLYYAKKSMERELKKFMKGNEI